MSDILTPMLSTGTLAALTGFSDYETLEEISQEFAAFVDKEEIISGKKYEDWTEAWRDYWDPLGDIDMTNDIMTTVVYPVDSSNVSAVGWDNQLNALIVAFRNSRVYAYFDASRGELNKIRKAKSVGEYINKQPWFFNDYVQLQDVRVTWNKENEGVRTGIKYTIDNFTTQLGHMMSALATERHKNVDSDNVTVILPENTPKEFFETLKQFVVEEIEADPTYTVVVGDTGGKDLMQVCNLNWALVYRDPTAPDPVEPEDDEDPFVEGESVPQVQPQGTTWGAYLGGNQPPKQAPVVPEISTQELPEAKREAVKKNLDANVAKIKAMRGKDGRKRVRFPNLGNYEEWIVAIAAAHAYMNKEVGGKLFLALPWNAPDELVKALAEHGVEIYKGRELPIPGTIEVGIYSE